MSTSSLDRAVVRLQAFVKSHDVSSYDAPVSVGFMVSGQMYLHHSLSSAPVLVESPADAAAHINSWLDQQPLS